MSAVATFYSSHMLWPDWTLGHFTASTTETKLSFNMPKDLFPLLTCLISNVNSVSFFMDLCESLWTQRGSEVLLAPLYFITVMAVSTVDVYQLMRLETM